MKSAFPLLLVFLSLSALAQPHSSIQAIEPPSIPRTLYFAGEKVPLNDRDVYERLEKEILSNTFFHSRTIKILKEAGRWRPMIEPILKEEGVPVDFFYLAVAESALDNRATSPAGAKGMWQLMAATAKDQDLTIDSYVDQRRDPMLATRAACKHIKELKEEFGSWTSAAAAYNRGESGLRRALEGQKVSSYYDLFLNQETYRYVFRILAYKLILENPINYGFVLSDSDLYPPLNYEVKMVDTTINSLPDFAAKFNTTYKMLKKYNPWLDHNARYMLFVPTGRSYRILIPKKPD